MNKSVKHTALYLFQIGVSGVLMLILMPIISQHLSPAALGQFVLAQVYTTLAVGIANLGVLSGYERNFFIFEKSEIESAQLVSSALIFVASNLALLLLIVLLFQGEISQLVLSKEAPEYLLVTVFLGTAASSLSQYYLTFLKNSGMAANYVKFMIVSTMVNFLASVLFLTLTDLGVMSLAYAWTLSNVTLLIVLFVALNQKLPMMFDRSMLREMLKISLPLTPKVFFGYLNTQFDKILLGLIGSSSLVGVYHMGQTFALTIFQFMTGLGRVFQPELYRKLFANKHMNDSYEINRYILPFFYIAIFAALIVAAFAKEFVAIFLSDEYQNAAPIIIILSLYYASLFFGKITGAQLIYAKKTHITTLLMFLGVMVNVGLNIPFIINWGIVGAAWATTTSGVIMAIIGYFTAQRYARILWSWKDIFLIYGIFIMVSMLSIFEYSFEVPVALWIKYFLVLSYIFLGFATRIISISKIKNLFL